MALSQEPFFVYGAIVVLLLALSKVVLTFLQF